jgi:hypothetical protein
VETAYVIEKGKEKFPFIVKVSKTSRRRLDVGILTGVKQVTDLRQI